MNKQVPAVIFLSLLVLVLAFSFLLAGGDSSKGHAYLEIGNEKIAVEIADTEQARQRGLMFRESLCDDCGMLFVFGEEGLHTFWMKNTFMPLDMVFIDAGLNVVDILHAVPCAGDFCESYAPEKKALYVLEVNGNKFNETIAGKKVKISGKYQGSF
jgi:uncharacterized membrane protein (UPF0127 family)